MTMNRGRRFRCSQGASDTEVLHLCPYGYMTNPPMSSMEHSLDMMKELDRYTHLYLPVYRTRAFPRVGHSLRRTGSISRPVCHPNVNPIPYRGAGVFLSARITQILDAYQGMPKLLFPSRLYDDRAAVSLPTPATAAVILLILCCCCCRRFGDVRFRRPLRVVAPTDSCAFPAERRHSFTASALILLLL
jgi:hypothetical protein